MAPSLSVVLHDVAPVHQGACERLMAAIAGLSTARACGPLAPRLSLLVVPRYHGQGRDARFEAWLQQQRRDGHELVLHGYSHWDPGRPRGLREFVLRRLYTQGEGEFAALGRTECATRLAAGLAWMRELDLPVQGFVAPAWLMGPGCWDALRDTELRYTCTLRHLVLLPGLQALHSPALVWSSRAAWRRQAGRLWNAWLARRDSTWPLMRIELHPGDLDPRTTARSWQQLLRKALQQGRAVHTLGEMAQQMACSEARAQTAPGARDGGPPDCRCRP